MSSGPGGPARYSIPYTGGYGGGSRYGGGYPGLLPYGGNPMMAGYPMMAANPALTAMNLMPQLSYLPFSSPSLALPLPDYTPSVEDLVLRALSTTEPDAATKQATAFTEHLTAAIAAGKITIDQAIRLSLGTADVLNAGAQREPAVKNLRAELKSVRTGSNLNADEFRKISDEIDALIRR